MKHEALKASYLPGQFWETMVTYNGKNPIENPQWVPVNGEPLWDENQEYRLAENTSREPPKAVGLMNEFQTCVGRWCVKLFGVEIAQNVTIRNFRFLEEALELVQALGCTKADALRLVDYVYARPVGEPKQEVGGTMVTLAALCAAANIELETAAWDEQARCERPEVMAKILAKQKSKTNPVDALPGTPT